MKLTRDQLTAELVRQLLSYDPETGEMRWLDRLPEHFSDGGKHSTKAKAIQWNGRFAGRVAFLPRNSSGYLHGAIMTVMVQGHRVAWAIHYGEWPNGLIDHINGDRADNRIVNLRVVDDLGNSRNQKRLKANKSGVTGVFWRARDRKWTAVIRTGNGGREYLGYFDDFDEAVAARKAAERRHGYHPNHGREENASAA